MLRSGTVLRATGLCALLALLMLPCYGGAAYADEEKPDPLHVQLLHVGALTAGWRDFRGEVPPPTSPDEVSDEDRPLFGTEYEECLYPVGQVDEMIELVYAHVQPKSWEVTEGAYLRSFGEHLLCVKNRPEIIAEVAQFLANLEARVLKLATVEVRAVRREAQSAERAVDLDRAFDGPAVSVTGFLGQRVSAFSGARHAYLQDFYVEVAQSASASNPVIGVANLGLGLDARVVSGGRNGAVTVELDVRLAILADSRQAAVGEQRSVEAPTFEVVTARDTLEMKPGVWTALSGHAGEGGWMFYARVTPRSPRPAAAALRPIHIRRGGERKMDVRILDVLDLSHAVAHVHKDVIEPFPSNFTPPERPELPEPAGVFYTNSLIEFLRVTAPPGAWEDPSTIEARNGRLIVRNTATTLADVEKTLDALRGELLRSLVTQVDVVHMPAALLAQLRKDAGDALVLSPGQIEGLRARMQDGPAHRTSRLELTGRLGIINTIQSGRKIAYVRDYGLKIAESASIAYPIMGRVFSGLHLEVQPHLTSGGKDVVLAVRFRKSHQPERMRRGNTPTGTVDLPHVELFRVHTGLLVPLGATVLLAAHGQGEERTVLLLTTRLRSVR